MSSRSSGGTRRCSARAGEAVFRGERACGTTLFALFAEVERDLISERAREGLAKARASGRKLGRPKGSLGVSRLDFMTTRGLRPSR